MASWRFSQCDQVEQARSICTGYLVFQGPCTLTQQPNPILDKNSDSLGFQSRKGAPTSLLNTLASYLIAFLAPSSSFLGTWDWCTPLTKHSLSQVPRSQTFSCSYQTFSPEVLFTNPHAQAASSPSHHHLRLQPGSPVHTASAPL